MRPKFTHTGQIGLIKAHFAPKLTPRKDPVPMNEPNMYYWVP